MNEIVQPSMKLKKQLRNQCMKIKWRESVYINKYVKEVRMNNIMPCNMQWKLQIAIKHYVVCTICTLLVIHAAIIGQAYTYPIVSWSYSIIEWTSQAFCKCFILHLWIILTKVKVCNFYRKSCFALYIICNPKNNKYYSSKWTRNGYNYYRQLWFYQHCKM